MSSTSAGGSTQEQPKVSITINISINPSGTVEVQTIPPASAVTGGAFESMSAPAADVLEKATGKAAEQNMDYSDCKGFDAHFMGIFTPLPTPNTQLKRQLATPAGAASKYILDYYHYSTMHHILRRMPVVSAINIDGDPAERQDDSARKDNWLRDNRIDFDVQLNDAYYKNSHFDKGHMSRREDAKWGDTPDDAERDAELTCMYTNAVPQVPDINRAIYGYHGLWGQLEQIILEKGVEKEEGNTTKICVYNGPIFVDTDPIYKSVQVPLRFYKIVVWKNGAGQPKTTAFILSQEDLVGGIQFEELQYDQEFKEHQCSIAYLETLTGLVFTGIKNWDTYEGDTSGDNMETAGAGTPVPVRPIDKEKLQALIMRNAAK